MLGVSLFSLKAEAATQECVDAPDCTELGYTQTEADCPNGAVKCPWNTGLVFCGCGEDYQYTCDGANEIAGDNKCGDYYAYCSCDEGYKWHNGSCISSRPQCSIGDIFYADNTCSSAANYNNSKAFLGIVVHVNSDGVGGQIMAPWPIDKAGIKTNTNNATIIWSVNETDIPSLPNYTSETLALADYDSCGNTDKIVAAGSANTYPAAWAARKYAPTPETAGKWCLPAAGIMANIYNKQTTVLNAIAVVGGVEFPRCCTWSSSESDSGWVWDSTFNYSLGLGTINKSNNGVNVRPVMEF